MGFNEVTWGLWCQSYIKSTKKLTTSQFDKIMTLAKKYMMTPLTIKSTTVIEIDEEEDNTHSNVVNHSSGSEPESESESSILYSVKYWADTYLEGQLLFT